MVLMVLMVGRSAWADEGADIRARMARGDLTGALQQATAASAAKPADAQLRFLRALVLMDLARDTEALGLFESLSQDYPELPEPLNNIALLQARGGRLDAALQTLQIALRADPTHKAARANLGQVHLMLAAQAWEQVVAAGGADNALSRRLEAVRALLAAPGR